MAKYSCNHKQLCCSVIFVIISCVAIPSDSIRLHQQTTTNHATLFVFGDSLFDPGNNNYINTTTYFQANFSPYGETSFKHPTGRFCNGRIIPDFIAEFANLPLIPPFLEPKHHRHQVAYGFNFASAGAGALSETNCGLVIHLHKQLKNFKKVRKQMKAELGESGTNKVLGNAVYLLSIGSNDYFSPSPSFGSFPPDEYISMVIGNITTVIQEIYDKGGRKFGILNLGPLGCLPVSRAKNVTGGGDGSCDPQANDVVELHNYGLAMSLLQLQAQLQGFRYSLFDSFSAALAAQSNPTKYVASFNYNNNNLYLKNSPTKPLICMMSLTILSSN
ncbi:OLC1v1008519C1 [Oldenlandia corymbosa var. corymbosa]|uniref:OLC1v1008519C1 n=1 Tax=Oldenlandia corymbosa var. corymbosa TaxID=529605 RepID=A0AAV1DLS9_OLDCO|nr:OLC1v1008519C1 [Oldenlandia corymbosa var. corymbosa]